MGDNTVVNTNLAALSSGTRTDTQTTINPNSMTLQEHMQYISNAISTTSDNVNKANIDNIFTSYYTTTDTGIYTPVINKVSNGKTTKDIPKILFASNNTMQLSSAEIDANVTGSNNEQYTMKLNFETTPSNFVENLQGTTEIESGLNNNPPATNTRGLNYPNLGNNCNSIIEEKEQAIRNRDQAIIDKDQAIAEKNKCINDKNQEAINYQNTIQNLEYTLANKEVTINDLNTTIQNQKNTISNCEASIAEKDTKIAEKDTLITQLNEELSKLRN